MPRLCSALDEKSEAGHSLSGDSIYVKCRKPTEWTLFQMSGNHKGSYAHARKNAYAVIEAGFTNVK